MPVRTPKHLETLVLLLFLAARRPREFLDRTVGYADLALERLSGPPFPYETVDWEKALGDLEDGPGRAAEILAEPALWEIEGRTRRLLREIRAADAFSQRWAADSLFARLCYLACRLTAPETVVETGVAYGVSSAYILKAMEQNGRGTLHSIDLPPLRREYERFWGVAVPEGLRAGWRLHRGPSGRLLPGLLREIGPLGLFVHDSLHTRRNMRREFDAAWPRLLPGGILLADDVERNRAFADLRLEDPSLWRVVRDRERDPLHGKAAPVVFGIAAK
ncbi:MAG TPA: class I SAM-dependent methyltransferase [Rubrobacter sp.]|nr:class I SAM-dependent methyltransferase [Rubrobacter sp.]